MRADHPVLVTLDDTLGLTAANVIAEGGAAIVLSPAARARCADAHARLRRIVEESRHVYGVTTGFGPLANRLVGAAHGVELQQNLIHHLASGLGPPLDWAEARAVVLARLVAVSKGASGASAAALSAMVAVLNSGLAPVLPSRGTVGASGDLTPLAHLVLCLQGRGEFVTANGRLLAGPEALERLGLPPLSLADRDGLALVNGTSAMTGVALRNALHAARGAEWALALSTLLAECLGGRSEAWHPEFGRLRPHPGQIAAGETLLARLEGGRHTADRPIALRRLDPSGGATEAIAGQDAYSLRCVPQVVGAVLDQIAWHRSVVETELNSVTDNPILPPDYDPPALHGGNFMGQHVALASDSLALGVTVLAGLAERQIARLTDERLNAGLPPFLHGGRAGLNSGLMGAQVTATAVLSEMRTVGAASVQSISTNAANQDVVSLGTIAARLTAAKLRNLSEIQAILAIAVSRAMDIRGGPEGEGFSPGALAVRAFVRRVSAPLEADRPLSEEIEALAQDLRAASPPAPPAAVRPLPDRP